jgi:hypothetical protein
MKGGFCQVTNDSLYANADFLKAYSKIAFVAGNDGRAIIRKWNQDIKIFIESNRSEYYKRQVIDIIQKLNPYLNTIEIGLADNKGDANCIIKIDSVSRTHYEISWDESGNIYKSRIYLNNERVFNNSEQIDCISQYLMQILGDFHFPRKFSPALAARLHIDQDVADDEAFNNIQSILRSKLNGFTEFDFKVIRLHYLKDIKPGISKHDFFDIAKKNVQTSEPGS